MYFQIIKRDLKRKKTMNIILLIFIILASMFVSSSVNNIITVTNALDNYFDKAGMTEYFAATMNKTGSVSLSELFGSIDAISNYKTEPILYLSPNDIKQNGLNVDKIKNTSALMSFNSVRLNYFDENDEVIKAPKEGEILVSAKCINSYGMELGDSIEITLDDISVKLKISGVFKDAPLGSNMMGMTRLIISEDDYSKFSANPDVTDLYSGNLCYISTSDPSAVEKVLSEENSNFIFMGDEDIIKMSYVMDMIIAGVLLVVSICLILVAFVVLRFTISFTLSEEYREIGVMKAIGIKNARIRGLYMIKYLVLAAVGAIIGLTASFPFGKLLTQSVSKTMIMGNDSGFIVNILCTAAVIITILLFCFSCTGKVKKFTPVDAIRSGATGERFMKKGIFRLSNSKIKPADFLAVNDVTGNPKRFGIIILTFTLCLSLLLIIVNTINTLKSDDLVTSFGIIKADVYLSDGSKQMSFMVDNGRELATKEIKNIEDTLSENGIPAKCSYESMFMLTFYHDGNVCKSQTMQGIGTDTDEYTYYEGTPPQSVNEIAVTKSIAKKLNAKIGDKITAQVGDEEHKYILTALFQSMNNMGSGVRIHQDEEINYIYSVGSFAFGINFTDNPNADEIAKRIDKIKTLYSECDVNTPGEYANNMIGISEIMEGVRILILTVVMIIIILIAVLMEYSFITKERGEIAILKAMGFRDGAIIRWHTMRFGISAFMSVIISLILMLPLTEISVGPIFAMMGADFGMNYDIIPGDVFVKYPLIVLIITLISAFVTSQHIRSVKSAESSNIE